MAKLGLPSHGDAGSLYLLSMTPAIIISERGGMTTADTVLFWIPTLVVTTVLFIVHVYDRIILGQEVDAQDNLVHKAVDHMQSYR